MRREITREILHSESVIQQNVEVNKPEIKLQSNSKYSYEMSTGSSTWRKRLCISEIKIVLEISVLL
jgi:hypothetical protein